MMAITPGKRLLITNVVVRKSGSEKGDVGLLIKLYISLRTGDSREETKQGK